MAAGINRCDNFVQYEYEFDKNVIPVHLWVTSPPFRLTERLQLTNNDAIIFLKVDEHSES
jgi:hypothetical protein